MLDLDNVPKYFEIVCLIENNLNYNKILAEKLQKSPATVLTQLNNLVDSKLLSTKKIPEQNKTIYQINYDYFTKKFIEYVEENWNLTR